MLSEFANVIVVGIATGAIYALLAVGYNVIFATTGVLNFAHGELFMVGTMTAAVLLTDRGWPVLAAALAALVIGAVLAALTERIAVRPATAKGRGAMGWVLSTLGVAIVIRSGVALWLGSDTRAVDPFIPGEPIVWGDIRISPTQLSLVIAAVLITIAAVAFYRRSRWGQALGAVAQDADAAVLRGIPVGALSALSFALGGALAAGAGFLASPLTGAFPSIGFALALKGFIAAALGGIPEIRGALAGGLALGVIEAACIEWLGAGYRDAGVFVALLAILAVRPAGMFGRGSVRAV